MTMFIQRGLQIPPLQAGLVVVPLALTFVIASRQSGARARHRGTLVLIEGCGVQIAGLALLLVAIEWTSTPSVELLALRLWLSATARGLGWPPCPTPCFPT